MSEDHPTHAYLVNAELIRAYSESELEAHFASIPGLGIDPALIGFITLHGVKIYKIVYRTIDPFGQPVLASGALSVPTIDSEVPLPLVSLHHGTIRNDRDAPSNFQNSMEARFFAPLMSSGTSAYIVAIPDYLGYGESRQIPTLTSTPLHWPRPVGICCGPPESFVSNCR
ncbi:MAG: amidohydrolase [Bacteroidia bacterium]|nr:amidohydrolase [Bacteroidia bacterium]